MRTILSSLLAKILILVSMLFTPNLIHGDDVASVHMHGSGIDFSVNVSSEVYQLRITGPDGYVFEKYFYGSSPYFSTSDGPFSADGLYTYELRAVVDTGLTSAAEENYSGRDTNSTNSKITEELVQVGKFQVLGSSINLPKYSIEDDMTKDQVILDDLIVDGSACVGQDCVNGESFGFDTLRLKENNLRIKFDDTSSTGSFPYVDWQLTANESTNGGLNKFSIDDVTNGKTPFTVEANAPTNSLYLDDGGRLGLGTGTPVVDLHTVSGNTPTLRLEQNGSSGFTPQTWDVAGNEANFFIRDATNGSKLPFKIKPGAPTNAIYIDSDGDIGFGDQTPDAALDLESGDLQVTNGLLRVSKSSAGAANMLELTNNGAVKLNMLDSSSGATWRFDVDNSFKLSRSDTLGQMFRITQSGRVMMGPGGALNFDLKASGNLVIAGTLSEGSSIDLKSNISEVDYSNVLEQLDELSISHWSYNSDLNTVHMGPMAEDFAEVFNLGTDNKHVASLDLAGVALASVKAIKTELDKKEQTIEELKERNRLLEERLTAIEKMLLEREQID